MTTAEYMAHERLGQKYCLKCHEWKPWPEFARKGRDRLSPMCAGCVTYTRSNVSKVTPTDCDYCGHRCPNPVEVRVEADEVYRVHADCLGRAVAYVTGEPMRDPVWEV